MSTRRAAASGDAHAIERAAAEWALRVQSGLRSDEQRDFEAWLRGDARHPALFAEASETSRLLDRLRDPALAADPVAPFEVPFAAAASAEDDAGAGIDDLRASGRGRWLLPASLVAAAAVVALAASIGARFSATRDSYTQSFATAVGASRTVHLPDGSVMRLNTDSAVEAIYTSAGRRVRLERGEAFFSVAKNPRRPFRVDAGGVSVRAVGTAFNVRVRPESVEVLVKEGKVSVNQPAVLPVSARATAVATAGVAAPAHFVAAGEQATVSLSPQDSHESPPVVVAAVAAPRLENALAWQEGRLEFTDTPLTDVVAEFNRYNRHSLAIGDLSLGAEPFGGTFAANGYEAFVEVLEQSFGVAAERRGHTTILRRASPPLRSR